MKHYPVKKIFFCLVMLLLFAVLLYKAFFYFDKKSEEKQFTMHKHTTRLSPDEMSNIEEGDFILRRGFGFISDYISKNLNNGAIDVTHAGILVKKDNKWNVIHSLSSDVSAIDGMQIQPLHDFLSYSAPGKIIITSPKNCTTALRKNISYLAQNYLSKKIPFDHKGKIDDANEFFCTELIWQILEKDLHHIILPKETEARRKLFYSMQSMYSSSYFDVKINQYQQQEYRINGDKFTL
jgi:hypothetical protein